MKKLQMISVRVAWKRRTVFVRLDEGQKLSRSQLVTLFAVPPATLFGVE